MATRLPEPLLTDAMTRLTGWSGDAEGISRTFTLDADHQRRLMDEVGALADRTGHPILVEQTTGGLAVTLVSGDVDGVSEVDIALATRISDLASGAAARVIPQQRQAELNQPTNAYAGAGDGDGQAWWTPPPGEPDPE